jgi:phospholipase D1/2
MSDAPAQPSRRIPRRVLLRFLLLPLLVAAGFAAVRWTPLAHYVSGPALATAITGLRHAWWAPALLVGGYVVLSPLGAPATPLMIAGGVVFGGAAGSLYNVLGVMLGGAGTYFLGRLLGRDLVRHLAGHRLRKVELAVARRGFWSLVALRFLPLPFPLVNYGAALAGIRPALFLATTALGVTPTVVIYTLFFAALSRAAESHRPQTLLYVQLAVSIALLLAVTLTPQILTGRRRRARLAELRRTRAARPAAA